MLSKKYFSKITIALAIGLLLAILVSPFSTFAKECNQIREDVLRMHIIPNSNSQQDQQVKLAVRDRLLQLDGELFAQAKNQQEAKQLANDKIEQIRNAVVDVLANYGCGYTATVEVCNMFFNTREYDTFTMPAGHYDAVRVILGEGEGYNWWCVLYPALCIPSAMEQKDAEELFTKEELALLQGKNQYEIRFASVELWEKIKAWFD